MRMRVAMVCLLAMLSPTFAAPWSISKSEQDPFDKQKGTFIATTIEGGHSLAVRCLEDTLSFAVSVDPGAIGSADEVEIKIVADDKDPISAAGGVLSANVFAVAVQFGDADTLDYLQGAKKYYLRVFGGGSSITFGFTGGRSFDDMLNRARKACGVAAAAPAPSPSPSPPPATAAIPPKWAKADCTKQASCATQLECLSARHELGDQPDADGFLAWCRAQPNAKP